MTTATFGALRPERLPVFVAGCALALAFGSSAQAADYYVKAGASGNGKSKSNPAGVIYRTLAKATAGDVIHVAEGTYSGKSKCGYLMVNMSGITLLGGYDGDFSKRDPVEHPTRIWFDKNAKGKIYNKPLIDTMGNDGGGTDTSKTVIDGFIFDGKSRNTYDTKGNLVVGTSNRKVFITLQWPNSAVRNCIFLNSAHYVVRLAGHGSVVENCMFVNVTKAGIDIFGKRGAPKGELAEFKVKNCTFLFCWRPGNVMTDGVGINIGTRTAVRMENCVFGYIDANAINDLRSFAGDDAHQLIGNVFFQCKRGVWEFYDNEQKATTIVETVDALEDGNLDEAEGNAYVHPLYRVEKTWYERYINRLARGKPGKLKMDEARHLRNALGLPTWGGKVKGPQGFAMAYPLEHVLSGALWTSSKGELKGKGFQPQGPFPIVRSRASTAAGPSLSYTKIKYADLEENPKKYIGKAVKFRCWYTGGYKSFTYLRGASSQTHKGLRLRNFPEMTRGKLDIFAYYRIGSPAERYFKSKCRGATRGAVSKRKKMWVSGVVRKPAKFLRAGAVIVEINEMGKK